MTCSATTVPWMGPRSLPGEAASGAGDTLTFYELTECPMGMTLRLARNGDDLDLSLAP